MPSWLLWEKKMLKCLDDIEFIDYKEMDFIDYTELDFIDYKEMEFIDYSENLKR